LLRRVYIKKSEGKLTPLGIIVIAGELVQIVAARMLNVIYEQDFLPSSFGYRPGVGPRKAVQDITSVLYREKDCVYGKTCREFGSTVKGVCRKNPETIERPNSRNWGSLSQNKEEGVTRK